MVTDGVVGVTVTRQAGGWVIPMEQPGSEMSIRVGSRRVIPKVLNYIDIKIILFNHFIQFQGRKNYMLIIEAVIIKILFLQLDTFVSYGKFSLSGPDLYSKPAKGKCLEMKKYFV